ncbi:MAG: DNA repair protein RecN [Mycobacteriaceae bacterium]
MLSELTIRGLGVIAEAAVELGPGLTVLTGETGAGKTMVVTGLYLLGGARADASRVRVDTPRAVVEGRFELNGPPGRLAGEVVASAGAEADEDGSVIAVRTVGADGRSRAHLGGRSVPAGTLAEFTAPLLAVHGQNDQLRLLRPAEQRAALDRSDPAVAPLLARYQHLRGQWAQVVADLAERTSRSVELAREAAVLRDGLAEVERVDPAPGEDAAILRTVARLSDLDALRAAGAEAQQALTGDADSSTGGALELVAVARAQLRAVTDEALLAQAHRLDEVAVVLADVGGDLSSYLLALPADGAELDAVLTRQAELKALVRSRAVDVDGVLTWAQQARVRLTQVDVSGDTLTALAQQRDTLAAELGAAAVALRAARRKAAKRRSSAVTAELSGLAMGQARLVVTVTDRVAGPDDAAGLVVAGARLHAGREGVDEVELALAAHDGAPALPIGRSASGGELSRVMLALEVVLAGADTTSTLVFDEVDAGVGGRAAVEIGRRLARLARTHQVIVVTHLPQVAAYADTHVVVDKQVGGPNGSLSGVRTLEPTERVAELARMLAGLDDTATGRAHAEELLATAGSDRQQ